MFARVTTLQNSPDQVEDIIRVARDQVLPAAQQMAGFQGMYALVDRQRGKTLSLTLWDSEEAMRASEAAADRLRNDAATSGGSTIQGVERYEIVMQP